MDNQEHKVIMDEENETKEETKDNLVATRGALPLDWTRVQPSSRPAGAVLQEKEEHDPESTHPSSVVRYPWDVADFSKQDEELIIVGTAGQKITRMGIDLGDHLSLHLKQLVLRSHLIRTMEGLSTFAELELLELYDNMIDALQALGEGVNGAPGSTLRVLDMSYNVIRDMTPVQQCPNLRELCK